MTLLDINGWRPGLTKSCVLGDTITLSLVERAITPSIAVTTKPGGSTATFSGYDFTPDVAGSYTITFSAGDTSVVVPLTVFAASVYSSRALAAHENGIARPDAERRSILNAMAQNLSAAQVTAWNSGTFPAGFNITHYGARRNP